MVTIMMTLNMSINSGQIVKSFVIPIRVSLSNCIPARIKYLANCRIVCNVCCRIFYNSIFQKNSSGKIADCLRMVVPVVAVGTTIANY